ncbi:MAG: UDP-N-acetylmuramoyl-L-alanine--D-glutamate ligase [Armatimonadetes bacterium]|nr:UDP-N-acetylmuramoyl-L-alanine--D-glutamate ligase [Armatimonadota bacterium]
MGAGRKRRPGVSVMSSSVVPVNARLEALRAEYEARYAAALFDVRAENGALVGDVLLPGQRDEALRQAGEGFEDRIRVLSDPGVEPLSWALPVNGWTNVLRAPLDSDARPAIEDFDSALAAHLSTQATADQPPMRVLAPRGAWRLVQLPDLTLGWAHDSEIRTVARGESHPWEGVKRAREGDALAVTASAQELLDGLDGLLGRPYILGGAHPEMGLDCSAFVQRLFWERAGVLLPKHTGDQRRMGVRVARGAVEPGDLLFFKSRDRNFSHVALALEAGGERLAHASMRQGKVLVQSFEEVKGAYAYLGARRPVLFVRASTHTRIHSEPARPIDLNHPETLVGHNVHVVGMAGAEGAAIVRFLAGHGVTSVTAHDFSTPDTFEKNFRLAHVGLKPRERAEALRDLLSLPIKRCLRDEYLSGIESARVIFLPQGWFLYENNAPLRALRARPDVVFSQMTDLYFRLAPCPVAAVTGTNGKSTTTKLLADLVAASGKPFLYGGNERRSVQMLDRVRGFSADGVMVLEVSNRQLMDLDPRPHVAVVTNVTPDHVDEHGSFEAYREVKRKLPAGVSAQGFAVLNRDNEIAWSFASSVRGRVAPFGLQAEERDGAWLRDGWLELRWEGETHRICPASALKIPGRHNISNALAASMAAFLCGVPVETIRDEVPRFEGIGLRLQPVGEVGGVRYFNDLKATTPEAALAGVEAFEAPLLVIVGGGDKGLDYTALARRLVERARHLLVLDSPGGTRIAEAVRAVPGNGPQITTHADLESAVEACPRLARPGDVVLLSPGCPGIFSMYLDENKGFGALVRALSKGSI